MMETATVLGSIIATGTYAEVARNGDTSDGQRTFQEICAENGFAYEEHTVVTEDGYILSVYRIPGKLGEAPPEVAKPPVYMQHGLLDSAYAWIMNYADVAPAFVASSNGYDVWLNNTRGNYYSRSHVSLDPDKEPFWNFDW
jgi:lysosomal acid lipase/cholesteryl ester hydrolase